jgi:hypothetical protein
VVGGADIVSVDDFLSNGLAGLRERPVIVTFIIDASSWDDGRIRYTCSLCGATGEAGPTGNPAVHNDLRLHLKQNHGMKGTSGLRSETVFDSRGGISAVEFFRA